MASAKVPPKLTHEDMELIEAVYAAECDCVDAVAERTRADGKLQQKRNLLKETYRKVADAFKERAEKEDLIYTRHRGDHPEVVTIHKDGTVTFTQARRLTN